MIIANPKSGQGQSLKHLKEIVLPLLQEAGFRDVIVRVTKSRRDATKIALEVDPQTIGGIIVLSGDGTLGEVMNGFYQHPKQKEVFAIPIGVVPTGSGAAIYQNIENHCAPVNVFRMFDERDMVQATLRICNWNPAPISLVESEIITDEKENSHKFVAIYVTSFGFMPEFFRYAEMLRWTRLGSGRYVLIFFYLKLFKKANYRCQISYVLPGSDEWRTYEDDFWTFHIFGQWQKENKTFDDKFGYLAYSKTKAKGIAPVGQYPESEFVEDRGILKVEQCIVKYLSGKARMGTDGEVFHSHLEECRMKIFPLSATILV